MENMTLVLYKDQNIHYKHLWQCYVHILNCVHLRTLWTTQHVELVIIEWINVERWLDDTEKGKQEHWETDLSHCHFFHYKSHMDYLGSNPGLRGERPATDRLNYGKNELPLGVFAF
jgi:hypothetical protein